MSESMTNGASRPFRILSLDGGGIRGAFTAVLSQSSIFGQNPKIGCQEFNDLQSPKRSKKQLCDRTPECALDVRRAVGGWRRRCECRQRLGAQCMDIAFRHHAPAYGLSPQSLARV